MYPPNTESTIKNVRSKKKKDVWPRRRKGCSTALSDGASTRHEKNNNNQGWANGSLNPSSLYVRGDVAHLYTRTQESIQHGLLEQKTHVFRVQEDCQTERSLLLLLLFSYFVIIGTERCKCTRFIFHKAAMRCEAKWKKPKQKKGRVKKTKNASVSIIVRLCV